jgi:hypothetical protein
MTWTADEARRWLQETDRRVDMDRLARVLTWLSDVSGRPGRRKADPFERVAPLMSLSGRRAADLLTLIAATKTGARGAEADLWREIDAEAQVLVLGATRAWNAMPSHREKRVRTRTGRIDGVAHERTVAL